MSGIVQYSLFCVWLISLNIMSSFSPTKRWLEALWFDCPVRWRRGAWFFSFGGFPNVGIWRSFPLAFGQISPPHTPRVLKKASPLRMRRGLNWVAERDLCIGLFQFCCESRQRRLGESLLYRLLLNPATFLLCLAPFVQFHRSIQP